MEDPLLTALETAMARQQAALPQRLPPQSTEAALDARGILITGPRGVGTTTFMLSRLKDKKVLYVSADSPIIAGLSLHEVASFAFSCGYGGSPSTRSTTRETGLGT